MNITANQALLEVSADLLQLNDVDLFWNRIAKELENFGITSLLYGAITSRIEAKINGISNSIIIKTNHPQSYFDGLGCDDDMSQMLDNDLSAIHCIDGTVPLIWHAEPDLSVITDAQKRDWYLSDELGFQVGITVPTANANLKDIGGTGLCAGELSPIEFDKMWADKNAHIMQILGLLDMGMRQEHLSSIIGLAPREKETLEWLTAGLRPLEVAHRMGIGYRTVDKYINSAK